MHHISPKPSYVHGASSVPLLGQTISENLRQTVERFPDHEALVVRSRSWRPRSSAFPVRSTARK